MGKFSTKAPQSKSGSTWKIISAAIARYHKIEGEQRAASFAYYAFFSLFPLIVLLVTAVGGSLLKNEAQATRTVTQLLQQYMPLAPVDQAAIVKTVNGFIEGRKSAGLLAFLTLAWSSVRFFQALVQGVNRAWGTHEHAWWLLPVKNFGMVLVLASGMVLGGILPTVISVVRGFIPQQVWVVPIFFDLLLSAVPVVILFYVILLFYKYAPRNAVSLREVLLPAMIITVALKFLQFGFGIYLRNYSNFNVIYGTFAGVMALLLWIYLSGSLVIFGGCLCAVLRELKSPAEIPRRRGR